MKTGRGWPVKVLILAGGLLAGSLSAQQWLLNGDFSQWDDPLHPTAWAVEDTRRTFVDSTWSSAGDAPPACRLTRRVAGSGNNNGIVQWLEVVPGGSCTLRARLRTPLMPDTMQWVRAGIFVSWYMTDSLGDSTFLGSTSPMYVHSDSWAVVETILTAPDTANLARVGMRVYGRSSSTAGGIAICDDVVFPGGQLEGVAESERRPVGIEAAPNPFADFTVLRFPGATPGLNRLRIRDAAGRTVRELSAVRPGHGEFCWDGCDARGTRLPGGIYFVVTPGAARVLLLLR